MEGIRGRLLKSFLAVILLTVLIFECILIISIRQYYFGNVEDILLKQAEVSANFYRQYLAQNDTLWQSAKSLLESFSTVTAAQVQIIDSSKKLLQDSAGLAHGKTLDFPDVTGALLGAPSRWQGENPDTGEPILAVSYPLMSDDRVVGAVRFVTSLLDVYGVVNKVTIVLLAMGLAAVVVSILAATILSQTIVKPVKEITAVAEEMAKGRFAARIAKRYDDEIGKLADTLNYMAREITRQDRLKNEFIASVSHELRTPLTAIKGWAITLLDVFPIFSTSDGKLFPGNKAIPIEIKYEQNQKNPFALDDLKEGLEVIAKESDRLTELVEELLDFSRLEAGRIQLNLDEISLLDMLNYIKIQMMQRARRQDVELEVSAKDNLPKILADENRIKQVLINLLDNAFKFTPPGGKIQVRAEDENGYIKVVIEDNGCGISREDLPNITKKFYKGNSKTPGSGLGLAICDEIVRLHNGRMDIISTLGKGTRVEIILPA